MLNNYVIDDFGFGCVQNVVSSTEITLKRGEYAKVSAWVKTINLNKDNTLNNYGETIGANITVKNTFNGTPQSDYGIYNIVTNSQINNGWEKYTFYVKADEVYETKFTVKLGLGYDNFSAEGTAFNIAISSLLSKSYTCILFLSAICLIESLIAPPIKNCFSFMWPNR